MSEKLKMRVSRLADDGLDAERVQETLVYHWDRILVAAGALVLLVALLVWGGVHFLTHDEIQPRPLEVTQTTPAQTLPEAPAPVSLSAAAPESLVPLRDSQPVLHDSQTVLQDPQTVKRPEASVSPVHKTSDTKATISPVKPAPRPGSASSPNKPVVRHELPLVRLSHQVSQLQLTRSLELKQPTDNLGNQVNLKGRSLVKVYLYSQLKGLKGQRVYHEWFHGPKRVARVEIRPYLQTMNASSSKYLTPAMTGRWTVKVVDHKGHLLAERHFRVVAR